MFATYEASLSFQIALGRYSNLADFLIFEMHFAAAVSAFSVTSPSHIPFIAHFSTEIMIFGLLIVDFYSKSSPWIAKQVDVVGA